MKVLIACEESQAVCKAFRARGHEAYSCDLSPCRFTDHPEWHIIADALDIVGGWITITTQDCKKHDVVTNNGWDLIIAHPPCTYLCVSGNKWFDKDRYGEMAIIREQQREDGARFFMEFTKLNCSKVAIENPVGCMSTLYRKPDQIIQPYQFGDPYRKTTCLWLKGLPKLEHTKIVEPEIYEYIAKDGRKKTDSKWRMQGIRQFMRSEIRSRTFPGIADAMAEQWGGIT